MTFKTPRPIRTPPPPPPPSDEESNADVAEVESDSFHNKQPSGRVPTVSRDAWLNTKLLKLLGLVYGIATPFVVWLVITIYNHNTELALQKLRVEHLTEKMTVIAELNNKMDSINSSINKIQIDIAILKTKAGIP